MRNLNYRKLIRFPSRAIKSRSLLRPFGIGSHMQPRRSHRAWPSERQRGGRVEAQLLGKVVQNVPKRGSKLKNPAQHSNSFQHCQPVCEAVDEQSRHRTDRLHGVRVESGNKRHRLLEDAISRTGVAEHDREGIAMPPDIFKHITSFTWQHISQTGEYILTPTCSIHPTPRGGN